MLYYWMYEEQLSSFFFILSFKIKIESSLWLTKIACNFLISKVQRLSGSLLLYLPACTCVSSYCKLFDFLDSVHCVCSLITSMSRFISMQDLCVKKKKKKTPRTKMLISTSKALICPFSCTPVPHDLEHVNVNYNIPAHTGNLSFTTKMQLFH